MSKRWFDPEAFLNAKEHGNNIGHPCYSSYSSYSAIPEAKNSSKSAANSRIAGIAAPLDKNYDYEERAAFLEYSGGYSRAEAESMAAHEFGFEKPAVSAPTELK